MLLKSFEHVDDKDISSNKIRFFYVEVLLSRIIYD
jgi:hypothetical protein